MNYPQDTIVCYTLCDPERPCYSVWMQGEKVAELYDPVRHDMYWYSYRVQVVDAQYESRLYQTAYWNDCAILDDELNEANPLTFPGLDLEAFCAGESDRVSFRSLGPPLDRELPTEYAETGVWPILKSFTQKVVNLLR